MLEEDFERRRESHDVLETGVSVDGAWLFGAVIRYSLGS